MTLAQPGLLLSGTLDPLQTIPVLLSALKKYYPEQSTELENRFNHVLVYFKNRGKMPPVGTPEYEDAVCLLFHLHESLDSVSPPGHRFRSRMGREIGWWPERTWP